MSGDPFDFSTVMPERTLVANAGWSFEPLTVYALSFDANGGVGAPYDENGIFTITENTALYAQWEAAPAAQQPSENDDAPIRNNSPSKNTSGAEKPAPSTGDGSDPAAYALLTSAAASALLFMRRSKKSNM